MTPCPHCSREHAPGETACPTPTGGVSGKAVTVRDAEDTGGDPANPDPLRGTTVDLWRITEKIGEGAMGKVYAAAPTKGGCFAAVKVLDLNEEELAKLTDTKKRELLEQARLRFEVEIDTAIRVGRNQPNIIEIITHGVLPDGRPYYVMEYLRGRSLARRIADEPPRGLELRRLLEQVCDALSVIHRAGVFHRDLKPDNIWVVEPEGAPSYAKILDFGVSKVTGGNRLTKTGTMPGTPLYMAPEQMEGAQVDERSDIYSLAVVIREILTGQCLFGGSDRNLAQLVRDVMWSPPPPLEARSGFVISSELEQLISDCLEKDPDRRPRTMAELKARLLPALDACANCKGLAALPSKLSVSPDTERSGSGGSVAQSPDEAAQETEVLLRGSQPRGRIAVLAGIALAALLTIVAIATLRRDRPPAMPAIPPAMPIVAPPAPPRPQPAVPAAALVSPRAPAVEAPTARSAAQKNKAPHSRVASVGAAVPGQAAAPLPPSLPPSVPLATSPAAPDRAGPPPMPPATQPVTKSEAAPVNPRSPPGHSRHPLITETDILFGK